MSSFLGFPLPDFTARRGRGVRVAGAGVALVLALAGCATNASSDAAAAASGSTSPTHVTQVSDVEGSGSDDALTALEALPVKGKAPKTGYKRKNFGHAWADTDRNGCDTRNDVLNRDLTSVSHKPGTHDCKVTSGDLVDPYTGKDISFTAGKSTSSAVQIDHVVSLSNAWQTGAQQLSDDEKKELANDPLNLLAVDGPTNQGKSDGDAATWLPSNKQFRCDYVSRQVAVKTNYRLWVTQAEKDAIAGVLEGCPGEVLPTGDDAPEVGITTGSTPEATQAPEQPAPAATSSAPAPAPAPAEPAPAEPAAPAPAEPVAPAQGDSSYPNCSAAKAAGAAPLHAGSPGYSSKLDRDGDGVACE